MNYIQVSRSPYRILNHIEHIKSVQESLNRSQFTNPSLSNPGLIELQLTDLCNLNCSFCHFRNLGNIHFDYNWIKIITEIIRPKAIVLAGGGEPTCYPRFNDAVNEIYKGINGVKLGLITNGVIIPKGDWYKKMDWVRISVYSSTNSSYGGRKSIFLLKKVIENIHWYLEKVEINHVGIGFLFYRDSITECPSLVQMIVELIHKYNHDPYKINIQFRPAYLVSRPSILSNALHLENIKFTIDSSLLNSTISKFEQLSRENIYYKKFLEANTNYEIFYELADGELGRLMNITNPDIAIPKSFLTCYFCLTYQLIVPCGDIYPCFTLAEYRKPDYRLCHITDMSEIGKNLKRYYQCKSECCNARFCRSTRQNEIVKSVLEKNQTVIDIPNDLFF